MKQTSRSVFSILIALAMVFTTLPMGVFAESGDTPALGQSGTITGFDYIEPVEVEHGTAEAAIPFPATVTATVQLDGDETATPATTGGEISVDVAVGAWQIVSWQTYDPDTADRYVFEAMRESMTLPDGVTLPDDFEELPCVAVDVGEVEIEIAPTAEVTLDGTLKITINSSTADTTYTVTGGAGSGTAIWVKNTKILTLNDFVFTTSASGSATDALYFDGVAATINLPEGSNSVITGGNGGSGCYGINSSSSLTITGSGTLTATSNGTDGTSAGIRTYQNLDVQGGTVTGIASATSPSGTNIYGVRCQTGIITVSGTGKLIAQSNVNALYATSEPDVTAQGSASFDGSSPTSVSWSSNAYRISGTAVKYVELTPASGGGTTTEPTALMNAIKAISGLDATWNGTTGTVTVTGTATITDAESSSTTLDLTIPEGVTVDWQANLTSNANKVISINAASGADSAFKMTGGSIASTSTSNTNYTLYINSNTVTAIAISGGTINGGRGSSCYGIYHSGTGTITVSGGSITGGSGSNCYGIYNNSTSAVTVSGGTVDGGSGSNSYGIYNNRGGAVTVSGGTVDGGSYGVYASSTGTGTVTVTDGTITGGMYGIYGNTNSAVIVSGGTVVGLSEAGIGFNSSATGTSATLSGDAVVFGYYDAIKNATTSISDNAVTIAKSGIATSYNKDATTDLTVTPTGATAKWDVVGGKSGVTYTNGTNTGFIEVSGVTVNGGGGGTGAATPSINTQPTGATYTQNDTATAMTVAATVSDGGTLSYQWYSNTTNSTTGGTAISVATSASYTPPTNTVGTKYYYVIVKNTKTGASPNTATATSNVAAVVVDPQTYTVSGTVTNHGGSNVSGATVKIMLGNEQQGTTQTTSNDGAFSFSGITPGLYNLVIVSGDQTMTVAVTVTNADVTIDQALTKLPQYIQNSEVEVKQDAPVQAVVGGLPEVYDTPVTDGAKGFTQAELDAIKNSGAKGEIKVVVNGIQATADETKIKNAATGKTVDLFIDLSVFKTINNGTPTTLTELPSLLAVTFDLTTELQGKTISAIYRVHGGSVDTITKSGAEYFEQDGDTITLHVKKFSTYGLAYTDTNPPVPPTPTPDRDSGSSGGSSKPDSSPAPNPWLEPTPAQNLATSANKAQQDYIRTKSTETYGVRKASWPKMNGYRYYHDTIEGMAVQVRLYVDNPTAMKRDILVTGFVKGSIVDSRKAFLEKWFSNKIRVIHMDEIEPWGQNVRIAAKVDLANIDTKKLYFYAYDKKTNKYTRITEPKYWIDKNGYLHFYTPYAGDIIISENPLKKR